MSLSQKFFFFFNKKYKGKIITCENPIRNLIDPDRNDKNRIEPYRTLYNLIL